MTCVSLARCAPPPAPVPYFVFTKKLFFFVSGSFPVHVQAVTLWMFDFEPSDSEDTKRLQDAPYPTGESEHHPLGSPLYFFWLIVSDRLLTEQFVSFVLFDHGLLPLILTY